MSCRVVNTLPSPWKLRASLCILGPGCEAGSRRTLDTSWTPAASACAWRPLVVVQSYRQLLPQLGEGREPWQERTEGRTGGNASYLSIHCWYLGSSSTHCGAM